MAVVVHTMLRERAAGARDQPPSGGRSVMRRPRLASMHAAIASTSRSAPRRPASCRPAGNPSSARPQGKVIAGTPDTLNGVAQTPYSIIASSLAACKATGAGQGALGHSNPSNRASSIARWSRSASEVRKRRALT